MSIEYDSYNISVEREGIRCTNNGEVSSLTHSQIFEWADKNRFISTAENEHQLLLKTPFCKSVFECYNKLEEITNVVLCELHNKNEVIWPCTKLLTEDNDKLLSRIYIDFYLDKKIFDKIKKIDKRFPKTLDEAYTKIEKQFMNDYSLLVYLFRRVVTNPIGIKETTDVPIEIITKENEKYLRILLCDTTPLEKCGINKDELALVVVFLFYCLIRKDPLMSKTANRFETDDFYRREVDELFNCLYATNNDLELRLRYPLERVQNELKKTENKYKSFEKNEKEMLDLALKYSIEGYDARYSLKTSPSLVSESVALIKDAISLGIDYNVVNSKRGIVEFINAEGHKEYVVDGNETSKDSYIFPMITDDKQLVKDLLIENNLNVPYGNLINRNMNDEEKYFAIKEFIGKSVVIKPRNTNYGTGITIISDCAEEKQITEALDYAFKFDDDILVEDFIEGKEYRFLIIGNRCISVVFRRSASVVGDGHSTIEELIAKKNKEPWHYLTETPVVTDEVVENYLKDQGYTYKSIIKAGERVYLRKNSNCSTGGESLDVTDMIPDKFKKIAERAAKCFKAKIAGVDMIIKDLEGKEYSIIEINDTPGYSINEWPYEGSGRKIGVDIFNLLGMLGKE